MSLFDDTNLLLIFVSTPTILLTLWIVHIQRSAFAKEGVLIKNGLLNKILRLSFFAYVILLYPFIFYKNDLLFTIGVLCLGIVFFFLVAIMNSRSKIKTQLSEEKTIHKRIEVVEW